MSKRNRLRKQTARAAEAQTRPLIGLKVGSHQFRVFDGLDATFGAKLSDYPKYEDIPEKFRRGGTPQNKAVSTIFFKGGRLADFGLRMKAGTDHPSFYAAFKALMCSFEPSHGHKEATCAWLVAEYTEAA